MIDHLIIRPEKPEDYKATEVMAMRSFWNKYWPGCTEHFLIRIIRESDDYLPEISRIAELDGRIVGAVYYTRAWLIDGDARQEIATFGPLAVEPTLEGNNIGGALMRETIRLAKEAGVAAIALMGEPNYYPRFGFKRGAEVGITDAEGNTFDALMCLPLCDDLSVIKGKLIESADFAKLEDEKWLEEINRTWTKLINAIIVAGAGILALFGLIMFVTMKHITEPLGSDVQFRWNHKGESTITKVIRNLLEN